MLEAIRLILEELNENILPKMDQQEQDDYVYNMPPHFLSKLKKSFEDRLMFLTFI